MKNQIEAFPEMNRASNLKHNIQNKEEITEYIEQFYSNIKEQILQNVLHKKRH